MKLGVKANFQECPVVPAIIYAHSIRFREGQVWSGLLNIEETTIAAGP